MKRFTTRELSEILDTDEWRVRRLFEDGRLLENERFGGKRVITSEQIPEVVQALQERGWLKGAQP